MSISFWLQINNLYGDWRSIFHISNVTTDSSSRVLASWVSPNGTSISICNSITKDPAQWFASPSYKQNTPTFITIVWYNLNVYVYTNGILSTSHTYTTPYLLANNNAILYIGDPWYNSNGGVQIKILVFIMHH
jgi:hypothetical protein